MTHEHDLTTAGWTPRESLPPVITTAYVICATQRSGSNLLCETLERSQVASLPSEYFMLNANGDLIRDDFAEHWSVQTFPQYYRACLRHCTNPDGVFGFKIQWEYLDHLVMRLRDMLSMPDSGPTEVLEAAFPNLHYIWLRRRDIVRQAVSYLRATHTDVWRSDKEKGSPNWTAPFDISAIDHAIQRFEEHEAAWEALFRSNGIEPYTVVYEDFAPNPELVAQDILRFLGLPVLDVEKFGPRRLKKQSDRISEQWVQRYLAIKPARQVATGAVTDKEPATAAVATSYMICSTERAGARLLCETLLRSHLASDPQPYFEPGTQQMFSDRWSTHSFSEYYRRCLVNATDAHGVFGFSIHWTHLDNLLERLRDMLSMPDAGPRDVLEAAFPNLHYIWVRRQDTVSQAVSLHTAMQTGIWWRKGPPGMQDWAADFDFDAIDALVTRLDEDDAAWAAFFRSNGIQPYTVAYEDFAFNPEPVAQDILRSLDRPVTPIDEFGMRHLQKQANEMTGEWIKRYRFIKADRARAARGTLISRARAWLGSRRAAP